MSKRVVNGLSDRFAAPGDGPAGRLNGFGSRDPHEYVAARRGYRSCRGVFQSIFCRMPRRRVVRDSADGGGRSLGGGAKAIGLRWWERIEQRGLF